MNVSVLASQLKFPEGPVVTSTGRIFCVELLGGVITEYHPQSKTTTKYEVDGAPNGLLVYDDFTLYFCDSKQHAIRALDLKTFQTKTLASQIHGVPLRAPNDLIKDSAGNILFTCPGGSQHQGIGYLCALTVNQEVKLLAENMYFPNGLLLINEEKNILINETWQHRILIGDYDKESLKITNLRPFYVIGGTAEPDGLTLSKDGLIYAAVFGTGKVWVFDRFGTLQRQIALPGHKPTNVCFDPTGELGLLVTEAENGQLLSILE